MASAVDSRLAYARPSAVATASRLPTATRDSNNSYTTSWDTTFSSNRRGTGPPPFALPAIAVAVWMLLRTAFTFSALDRQ